MCCTKRHNYSREEFIMNTGYLGDTTPKLGFGLMRLPMIGDEIDMEQVKAMVDTFMAKGFTYFDTAYVYINGKSEVAAKAIMGIKSRHNGNSFRKGFLFICIITVFKAFYNENFCSRDFLTET